MTNNVFGGTLNPAQSNTIRQRLQRFSNPQRGLERGGGASQQGRGMEREEKEQRVGRRRGGIHLDPEKT